MAKSGIQMRALKDFRGRSGEGSGEGNRMVEAGDVFTAVDQGRADYLQKQELAVVESVKSGKVEKNKMASNPENKAMTFADENKEEKPSAPLSQDGGKTGEDNFASLSAPDRRQPKRTSKPSAKRGRK